MKNMIRLNKFLAMAGVCSRRKADSCISSGLVKVNNVTVREHGTMVDPGKDRVRFRDREINSPGTGGDKHVYLVLNKPAQVVTTVRDPQGRKTVMDFLPEKFRTKRLFPVGRLDYFSQGLIILTTDGELTHRLTHPSWNHQKVYEVIVREKPEKKTLETMSRGMTLSDGQRLAPVKVRILASGSGLTTLEMVLTQGVNRQIRRMCADLGLTILKLTRISQGPVRLRDLKTGQCMELDPSVVRSLLASAGLD